MDPGVFDGYIPVRRGEASRTMGTNTLDFSHEHTRNVMDKLPSENTARTLSRLIRRTRKLSGGPVVDAYLQEMRGTAEKGPFI